ncbi:MAG: FAD-dependent oxidoreductase [Thermoanaerobaculales bacterium]|jgi:isorenieratene synthase|nr:FAD-dependent oxidoreductase [Thermoanaerobaculales bacterium]
MELILPQPGTREKVSSPQTAVIAGGGLAGVAAAVVLAERGVSVVLAEREPFLGGRAGAWTDRLATGEPFEMERGFHAFFRQYYNLQALLRRIDGELGFLEPLEDYPILGPGGQVESFSGLPNKPPWNVIALTRRTPTLGLRDLLRVNGLAALSMLRYERGWTYGRYDDMTAGEYLDSLRFPPDARRMLFDVFAHSFFNPENAMSAGELLMMFHFYFSGNPDGLIFDVSKRPFSTSIWGPLGNYLSGLGVDVRTGCTVSRVAKGADRSWKVELGGESVDADHVVLALTVPGLQAVVGDSLDLDDAGFRRSVEGLALTNPFVVWRLWVDRPTKPGRQPFVGTTGVGCLDNISLYDLFEDESRDWAARTGGSVVELHAYAVDPGMDEPAIRADLLSALHTFYPEYVGAGVIEERFLIRRDCPAFAPGSHADRPGVTTPHEGIALAGDFVRLPIPSALMERAVASGFLAANHLLAPQGVRPEPIRSIPRRGLFGRRVQETEASRMR